METDSYDPYDDPTFKAYMDRAEKELIPKLTASAITVSLVPDNGGDIKFALELGLSVMMDKPIIGVVSPGTKIPEKLSRVVDRWVEGSLDDPTSAERLSQSLGATITDMLAEQGEHQTSEEDV